MASPLVQRYDKAREACALFHMEDWAILRLEGKDTRDYLHRISTADVKQLKAGDGTQTLFLQGDGRLIADCVAVCIDEAKWLLVCPPACKDALATQVDRFLFTEDVAVTDVSSSFYTGVFLGPKLEALAEFIRTGICATEPHCHVVEITLAPAARRGMALIPTAVFAEVKTALYEWLEENGGVIGDQDLYNTFRIEAGCPLIGKDLTEKTIPLEAGQKPAINFTKGCFPGQEIVARINNLGHPANILVGLSLPETTDRLEGCELQTEGKVIGRITSVCYSPLLRNPLGLGYVKWTQREPGTVVTVAGDDNFQATVLELPVPGADV